VYDFHLWRVAPGRFALIVGIESSENTPAEAYKRALSGYSELCHVTVEVRSRQGMTPKE
jgi:Co/Zn/Cd efflux system component